MLIYKKNLFDLDNNHQILINNLTVTQVIQWICSCCAISRCWLQTLAPCEGACLRV